MNSVLTTSLQLRKISFKVINSLMKLIPEWKWIIAKLNLAPKMIPRDVLTHWNSTFDMLDMALEYQKGVIVMTKRQQNGLCDLELSNDEWDILGKFSEQCGFGVPQWVMGTGWSWDGCRSQSYTHALSVGYPWGASIIHIQELALFLPLVDESCLQCSAFPRPPAHSLFLLSSK